MALIPTWPIAVGTLVIGLAVGAFADHKIMRGRIDKLIAQHTEQLRVREVQRATDERTARNNERQLVEAAGLIEQEKTNEIDRIRRAAADSIARLQNRPDRQPARTGGAAPQASACQGATGAELSRSDAVFLDGEATRADELRAALSSCYKAYDSGP